MALQFNGAPVNLNNDNKWICQAKDLFAQMHKTLEGTWVCSPPIDDSRVGYLVGSNSEWNKMQKECCEILQKYFHLENAIPILEEFAFNLHTDFLRIDVFPTSFTDFWINELEVTSGFKFVHQNLILNRLKYGWKRINKYQSFINVEKALDFLSIQNEKCDITFDKETNKIKYSKEEETSAFL